MRRGGKNKNGLLVLVMGVWRRLNWPVHSGWFGMILNDFGAKSSSDA